MQEPDIRKGVEVTRLLGGVIPMKLTITRIDPIAGIVYCGAWKFDFCSAMEIDEELEWGPSYGKTGSYLQELLDFQKYWRWREKKDQEEAYAAEEADEDE